MAYLDGINFYGDYTTEDKIAHNVTQFFKYGLLEIGAYYNIGIDQTNHLGQNVSVLAPLRNYGITNYTIYKGLKQDWVWEQGMIPKFSGATAPIQISGVFVNSTFYATGTNVNGGAYYVDYSRGQIVFSNPLASTDVVKVARTERGVNIYPTDGPEFRTVNMAWRTAQGPTGITNLSYQAYLPAIFVGIRGLRTLRGVELGHRAKVTVANLEFDIIAANSYEAKKLSDIIYMMETKGLPLYDLNRIDYPLNTRGELISSGAIYPNHVNNADWKWAFGRFQENCRIITQSDVNIPLYHRKVNIGLELDTQPF